MDFAESLGVNGHNYTAYERGISVPNLEALGSLASREGVNLHWLLTGDGDAYLPNKQPSASLDADLMETVVMTVAEFQAKNRRFKVDPEKRWLVYMLCYRKLVEMKDKYPPETLRAELKQECNDLLKLASF